MREYTTALKQKSYLPNRKIAENIRENYEMDIQTGLKVFRYLSLKSIP